ncbi:ribonuclease H-like domain, reverse transcriptase, RNA-dependent DNA polymerase, partial [Tanacetum coccineum]
FINQQVWKLVPLPADKHAIGTKWILKNKRDARGIVVWNKAWLVAQGHRQEEVIDYDEMDVKSAFLYGEIEEEVYPRQVMLKTCLSKFDMESVRTATIPYEAAKTQLKDETDPPVNVHLYRSMIGSLMYLTALRPDIMFAVSACSRHQVTPLTSHLNAVKKIFKYLKGQPKLGLCTLKDSPFQLEATVTVDYAWFSWYSGVITSCWIMDSTSEYQNSQTTKHHSICEGKPSLSSRTKHIDIRHHFIREANEKELDTCAEDLTQKIMVGYKANGKLVVVYLYILTFLQNYDSAGILPAGGFISG